MNILLLRALLCLAIGSFASSCMAAEPPPAPGTRVKPLFDGRSLQGWEGNPLLWRVADGALTGGSLTELVKHNDFLATTQSFTNFIVRMKIKLTGSEGFINSGFQIRSQRVPNNSEMEGYQCDFGDPTWWGAIYDESRRNRVVSASDMKALGPVIKRNDWNEYVIRADGPRITTWINGIQGTDYIEPDPAIPDFGRLGIQVHGGGKALVQVKDITIEELPPTTPGKHFIGAPQPAKRASNEPLSPEEQLHTFKLPPGFKIELVAHESEGLGKFITVDWDLQGRMWSMTALEYPVDANESPAAAKELYASRAKDKVLVWDHPFDGRPQTPRIFADGLAIPLGILPYRDGVYIQHGPDIVFLNDSNKDGSADERRTILTGFGVQDSHLFPHQFTRAPGNWIWMAQGAFNYGKVKTTRGAEHQFDRTRMARFRYDGSDFEITSQGPCNIWGLAITAEGETWIQEANDFGYPAMPFHEFANYPGCSDAEWKSYAPEFPGTAPDFQMGGTGLSGLAISDRSAWPEAYAGITYIANPITRKIQAIKAQRNGGSYKLQKLPDFVLSSDEMFRPVALRLGPDGCLYIVDWYNKIISHNEVPRNHPERDKKRGRIWRVSHETQKPFDVPNFWNLQPEQVLAKLGGESLNQHHLAWQAIIDRSLTNLAPELKAIITRQSEPAGRRIGALWALEGLESERFNAGPEYLRLLEPLFSDENRNVRREAFRVIATRPPSVAGSAVTWRRLFDHLQKGGQDSDPEVRAEVIKTTARLLPSLLLSSDSAVSTLLTDRALPLLVSMAKPPLSEPTTRSTHKGHKIKAGEAYEREFERYLVRLFLERYPDQVASFLDSEAAKALPIESQLVASLALEPKTSASRVARLLPRLTRPPAQEEMLRLAQFLDQPGVAQALQQTLKNEATRNAALDALISVRNRLDAARLAGLLEETAQALWKGDAGSRALSLRLTSAFKLGSMSAALNEALRPGASSLPPAETIATLRALRELGSANVATVASLARNDHPQIANEAVAALAASRQDGAAEQLLTRLWNDLSAVQRRTALDLLAGSKPGASAIVKAAKSGALDKNDLEPATLDRLHAVLGEDKDLMALINELAPLFRPALRLDGNNESYADANITLSNAFTVETWVKFDEGVGNEDGILGAPGSIDMNFFGGIFRVYCGDGLGDRAVARKKMTPNTWTHVAVTRDAQGVFRTYLNGELESTDTRAVTNTFVRLDIGRTIPPRGTAGWLSEFRVWNIARTPEQIRSDFDRTYPSTGGTGARPQGLVHSYGAKNWPTLRGTAKVANTSDHPPLLTPEEALAQAQAFNRVRSLAETQGDVTRGKTIFTSLCTSCHSVAGQGGQIGPVLNGAAATGTEALLRNILTPNAAMEAGYRTFRVELKDGDVVDGLLVSQDNEAIVLRRPNTEDTRIAQKNVRRAAFVQRSLMPEGLLDPLKPNEVADLFTYLRTLK